MTSILLALALSAAPPSDAPQRIIVYVPVPAAPGDCLCFTGQHMCRCPDAKCACAGACSCKHCAGKQASSKPAAKPAPKPTARKADVKRVKIVVRDRHHRCHRHHHRHHRCR